MTDLLIALLPLIIGSALVPLQILITIMLLRSRAGRGAAVAWVAGLGTVRVAQGLVLGLLLGSSSAAAADGDATGPGLIASTLLLVVAVVFYVGALRKLLDQPDEDAAPPAWMSALDGVTPGRAYLLGIGLMLVGLKFWAFTLGALALIEDAALGMVGAGVAYLVFTLAAMTVHLVLVAVAYLSPGRSDALLVRIDAFLTRYDRPIMVSVGVVFGTWFMAKALDGLGIL